jgi:hypothetical protein
VPDVRVGAGTGGETLAVLALLVPLLVVCFFFLGTVSSTTAELAISCGTILLTAILLTIDASWLGTTDLKGRRREGVGTLFVGMLILWVVFYPVMFFRRRHFGRPNLGILALTVAAVFVCGPFVKGYLIEGVLPGGGPPSCTSPAVIRLVDDLIRKAPAGASVRGIRDHRELSYDRATGIRNGQCVVETATGQETVKYMVSWLDARTGNYQVQIRSVWNEDPPLCTSPGVKGMVEKLVKDSFVGVNVQGVEGFQETGFDRPGMTRFGLCTVRTNQGNFRVDFQVQLIDKKTGQFQVQVGRPAQNVP